MARRFWIALVLLGLGLVVGATSCTKLSDVTAPSCAFALSSGSASFNHLGGTGIVTVRAATSCAWTVTTSDSWIALTSSASGTGDGNIGYSVATNDGETTRRATLNVAGQAFTVSQTGCSYAVAPIAATFSAAGGSGVVSVTADDGCAWSATTGTSWITISSGHTGTGSGNVNYSVPLLLSMNDRSGTLTVAKQTVTVSQVVIR